MAHYDLYQSIGLDKQRSTSELQQELERRLNNNELSNPGGRDELQVALQILSDQQKRDRYDAILADPTQPELNIAGLRDIADGTSVKPLSPVNGAATVSQPASAATGGAYARPATESISTDEQKAAAAAQFLMPTPPASSDGEVKKFLLDKGSNIIWFIGVLITLLIVRQAFSDDDESTGLALLFGAGALYSFLIYIPLLITALVDLAFRFIRDAVIFQRARKEREEKARQEAYAQFMSR